MDLSEELASNGKSFLHSAKLIYETGDWTSATILYFKAIFVLIDRLLLINGQEPPKDHTERFRALERKFLQLYLVLDSVYYIYRNTYSTKTSKADCEKVKKLAEKLASEQKI